jgi:hypothetical protein
LDQVCFLAAFLFLNIVALLCPLDGLPEFKV